MITFFVLATVVAIAISIGKNALSAESGYDEKFKDIKLPYSEIYEYEYWFPYPQPTISSKN